INEPQSQITLLYCSRSEEQIIFHQHLTELEGKYPGKIKVVHHLTQPSGNWTGYEGRLDSERIRETLTQYVFAEADKTVYLTCGTQGLIEATRKTLEGMGVKTGTALRESFFKEPTTKTEAAVAPSVHRTRQVKVIVEGE